MLSRLTLPAALVVVATSCSDRDVAQAKPTQGASAARGSVSPSSATPTVRVQILERIPHDTSAFTQGLLFHRGTLYESTGLRGASSVRRVESTTGTVEAMVALPREHFGEGIAVVGDRLYQLTWKSGIALVYDVATLTPRDTLRYHGEGWGLTTFGDSLIMSDGTSRLRVIDPVGFRVARTVDVTDADTPVKALNELEYIDGEVWANVHASTWIARIDPISGRVRGWVDVTDVARVDPRGTAQNVTNGIAFDAATGRILITGKRWSFMYVVELQ